MKTHEWIRTFLLGMVTAFLAILELVRMRIVRLSQPEPGGDILLARGAEHGSTDD